MSVRHASVGLRWPYPLSSPSWRFTFINDFVRGLDLRFAALPGPDQDEWNKARQDWPWWARCVPWIFDYDPFDRQGTTALAAYRSVNASRLTQGLNVADLPPVVPTFPDSDTITPVGSGFFGVLWSGRGSIPAGSYVADVWAKCLTHPPERGPSLSKYRYAVQLPITYEGPLDCSAVFDVFPGFAALPCVSLAVAVSDMGAAPFVGRRAVFESPY